ncbi:hypothetical protein NL676_038864 [Syzygium grande]|nr:hypothetical protein NL676_038864 [Syzygium grande]
MKFKRIRNMGLLSGGGVGSPPLFWRRCWMEYARFHEQDARYKNVVTSTAPSCMARKTLTLAGQTGAFEFDNGAPWLRRSQETIRASTLSTSMHAVVENIFEYIMLKFFLALPRSPADSVRKKQSNGDGGEAQLRRWL